MSATPADARPIPRWRQVAGGLAALVLLATAVPTALMFLARLHWALDNLTAFVVQYAAAAAVCLAALLALRRWQWAVAAAVVLALNLLRLLPVAVAPAGEGAALRVVSANVNFRNRDPDRVLAFVREAKPDVLVVLEFTPAWNEALAPLRAEMPHAVVLPRDDPFGIALFSRIPLEETEVDEAGGTGFPSIVARLDVDGEPLTVIGSHPPPPVNAAAAADRNLHFSQLARRAETELGEVILAGDLNVSPWSPHFRDLLRVGRLADSRRGFSPQATWPTFFPPLMTPIDHVLVSDGVAIADRRLGPELGSDHRPVIADVTIAR